MPTKQCIEHNGKTYCWNQDAKQVEEIVRKPVEISNCPTEALRKLMALLGEHNDRDN